jgi:signal transduction histidine kinase
MAEQPLDPPARVLVVEDDVDIRSSLVDLLTSGAFQVDASGDGGDALDRLRAAAVVPDVILLDLRMPKMDGWTFRAEQRRDPGLAHIPVVAMSGDSSPQAEAIDAAAFLAKPLDPRRLLSELRRVVEESRSRRLSEAVAHRERLAGLGRLAAGVAHEISNPLAWLSANLRLLHERLPGVVQAARPRLAETGGPEAVAALEEMPQLVAEAVEGATRIRDIVVLVRSFSQPQAVALRPLDLFPALDSALKMMDVQTRHRVKVERDLRPVPEVKGDPTQVSQLFVNLLMNAADAVMARPGSSGRIQLRTRAHPDGVEVVVADDGVGMTEAVRRRIFEPFFTTKEVGKGTGLGLFVCHSIVNAMGGRLEVESEVDRGTTIRVLLPKAASAAAPVPPAPERTEVKRARLLVVEDEPILGRALLRLLGRRFQVELAQSVDAAVALLGQGLTVDAILCDIHMPGKGGPELHRQVQERYPALEPRMVFMSGGSLNAATEAFMDQLGERVLPKPLDLDQLEALLIDLAGGAER